MYDFRKRSLSSPQPAQSLGTLPDVYGTASVYGRYIRRVNVSQAQVLWLSALCCLRLLPSSSRYAELGSDIVRGHHPRAQATFV